MCELTELGVLRCQSDGAGGIRTAKSQPADGDQHDKEKGRAGSPEGFHKFGMEGIPAVQAGFSG
jgi:hypothetical protein